MFEDLLEIESLEPSERARGLILLGRAAQRCSRMESAFATHEQALDIHREVGDRRGEGIGSRLLDELERRARERGCCKITLEVHDANVDAKRLYERSGFGPWDEPTLFVTKPLT